MIKSLSYQPNGKKWSLWLLWLFATITVLSFTPWESIFSIQIRDRVLEWLTGTSIGLFGVLGLMCTIIFITRTKNDRISIAATILSGFISVVVVILLALNFVLPDFNWNDTAIYRNGNDYLVIQEQETFVTSNETYPRIIRTTSPYGMIRIVEEQVNLNRYDSRFQGDVITYEGKIWRKEPL
ncbi:MAG: hypothetical protein AAGC65_15700 [Mucilaginibacter sp.]|uniref:hypothetical protein n=1 Tax=Mucilaginibacter sp. TaxID=1882438 RepID=UPI0031AAFAC6